MRKDITRQGGDGNTRTGEGKLKAEVVTCDEDKEMVMGHVETYYERQRSISSIMSGGGEGEAVETCRKCKGTSLVSST